MKVVSREKLFDPSSEDSILEACKNNVAEAQKLLIKQYIGFAKGVCRRYAGNDQVAEEILNDSFLKVFTNLKHYDKTQAFQAWLRTIVVRTAIDYYRKSLKDSFYADRETIQVPDLTEDVVSKISAEEILQMVQRLSPAYRLVFTLFVIDGYSHKEIAQLLGIKEGTSKSNLQDARQRLQVMILKANPHFQYAYE